MYVIKALDIYIPSANIALLSFMHPQWNSENKKWHCIFCPELHEHLHPSGLQWEWYEALPAPKIWVRGGEQASREEEGGVGGLQRLNDAKQSWLWKVGGDCHETEWLYEGKKTDAVRRIIVALTWWLLTLLYSCHCSGVRNAWASRNISHQPCCVCVKV